MKYNPFICLLLLFAMVSCKEDDSCGNQEVFDPTSVGFAYENLTHELYQIQTSTELDGFFQEHPVVKDQFFGFANLQSEEDFFNEILNFTQSPVVKDLYGLSSYAAFESTLDQNRSLREFLTFLWINKNPDKTDQDIFELISKSQVTQQTSVREIAQYLAQNQQERSYYEVIFDFISEEQALKENFEILKNPGVDTIYYEILQVFDVDALAFEIGRAFANVQKNFPDFAPPKVKFVYSAFGKDMYLTDSTLVIGLDYYLGEGATYRPNIYDYLLTRMRPEYIIPQVVQYVSLAYNPSSTLGDTMLDEMIYHGKALAFTQTILPCTADSIIMGYSQQDFANASVSEAVIWSHFLENELVYEENPNLITKYVDERPNVPEIDPRCPGRIGRYIGWQMVKNYLKNEKADLKELLIESNSQHVLRRSKYNPRLP